MEEHQLGWTSAGTDSFKEIIVGQHAKLLLYSLYNYCWVDSGQFLLLKVAMVCERVAIDNITIT